MAKAGIPSYCPWRATIPTSRRAKAMPHCAARLTHDPNGLPLPNEARGRLPQPPRLFPPLLKNKMWGVTTPRAGYAQVLAWCSFAGSSEASQKKAGSRAEGTSPQRTHFARQVGLSLNPHCIATRSPAMSGPKFRIAAETSALAATETQSAGTP